MPWLDASFSVHNSSLTPADTSLLDPHRFSMASGRTPLDSSYTNCTRGVGPQGPSRYPGRTSQLSLSCAASREPVCSATSPLCRLFFATREDPACCTSQPQSCGVTIIPRIRYQIRQAGSTILCMGASTLYLAGHTTPHNRWYSAPC